MPNQQNIFIDKTKKCIIYLRTFEDLRTKKLLSQQNKKCLINKGKNALSIKQKMLYQQNKVLYQQNKEKL